MTTGARRLIGVLEKALASTIAPSSVSLRREDVLDVLAILRVVAKVDEEPVIVVRYHLGHDAR